jgi:hypothetical protein
MPLAENKGFRFLKPNEPKRPFYFENNRKVPAELREILVKKTLR